MSNPNREISQAMRKRNGTKYRINKQIPEIKELVNKRGSRTQIRYLKSVLEETLSSAIKLHEALMLLIPDDDPRFNDEWIDELSINVNSCFSEIERYLLDRQDDPPSSLVSSQKRKDIQRWRENSREQSSESSLSDMCDAFSKMYVEPSINMLDTGPNEHEKPEKIDPQSIDVPLAVVSDIDLLSVNLNTPIRSTSEHGGARARESLSNPTTNSEPIETKILSPIQSETFSYHPSEPIEPYRSTEHFKSYLNPSIEAFTPLSLNSTGYTKSYQPIISDQLHSTYTVSSPALTPHVIAKSSTLPPQANVRKSLLPLQATHSTVTLTPHANVHPKTLTPRVNVRSTPLTQVNVRSMTLTSQANVNSERALSLHASAQLTTVSPPANIVVTSTPHVETSKKSKSVHFTDPILESIPVVEHRSLDQWIDELDPNNMIIQDTVTTRNIQMELLIQQRLPRQELITFSGEADKWIEFVSKFYDIVHKQPYLDAFQKRTYLTQHLKGEALRSIEGFANDDHGYVNSLKKLKYLYGNKVLVAQSVIRKITKFKQVADSDSKSLANFYFEISTCLNTLLKMNYVADVYSTDLLRQILSKLPVYLQRKWSEYSLLLRRREEPNLFHFEKWLQDRVMATRDPYLMDMEKLNKVTTRHTRTDHETDKTQHPKRKCILCSKDHWLYRCDKYKSKTDSEKMSLVKKRRLCFNCLSDAHNVKLCKSKNHCFVDGCQKRHHTSLHHGLLKKAPDKNSDSKDRIQGQTDKSVETTAKAQSFNSKQDSSAPKTNSESPNLKDGKPNKLKKTITGLVKSRSHVFLQVVPVRIKNHRGDWIDTFAMLDTGSQCTLVTKSLCKQLNLQGRKTKINFGTIRDNAILQTELVDLTIAAVDGTYSTKVKNVYSLDDSNFNVPGQEVPITEDESWDYIRDLNIQDIDSSQVQILIGADVPDVLISHDYRTARKGYPYAAKTQLGWTLLGVYDGSSDPVESRIVALTRNLGVVSEFSEAEYRSFWETEAFGTEVANLKPISLEDQRNQELLDKETEFKDGHYVIPMLWKPDVNLPESKPIAEKRLNQLCRRFQANPEFFQMYAKNIESYLEKGYITKLTDEEAERRTANTWYIPHHGVVNVNKPGKVRMVFDAAAQSQGESLNSNLFSGPDLLNSLLGVLLRFRRHKVAVVADIEAMFCQVRLKEKDTDANRFLWRANPWSRAPPDEYKLLVHIFGLTDSPCAATYGLQRAAKDQESDFPAEVVEAVLRNFYVDDLLMSYPTIDEGKNTSKGVIRLLSNKGFNLTKFQSNEPAVLEDLPPEKLAEQPTGIKIEERPTSRALGVQWDLQSDCFIYKVNIEFDDSKPCTKRSILKQTATIYDPLGLLTPITLVAKLFMQELWRYNLEWDDEVPDSLKTAYSNWLKRMSYIASTVAVPRSLNIEGDQDIQLHIFCDASEKAFSANAYVRIKDKEAVSLHILVSKSRVAPLKRLTLPRLELQGAVIAVRMKETITQEIDVEFSSVQFWTDSSLNLQYINNESKRFKVFVANRVAEIRNHSDVTQWNFVPGNINPVDIATRGDIDDDEAIKCWFNGPEFLFKDETDWPTIALTPLSADDNEIKKQKLVCKVSCVVPMVQFERFTSWRRLIRAIGWALVFARSLTKKRDFLHLTLLEGKKRDFLHLTLDEERKGRQKTLQFIQNEAFNEDIRSKELSSKLAKLDPYVDEDDGLLRVGGRLKRGNFPYATKHQIILPKNHHAVLLLIKYHHEQFHHVGTEHLISLIRQEYWIIGVRVMVKQVIRKCITCQKRRAKPSQVKMADLPADRITIGAPTFFHTGVDFFGPIEVKVLRSKVKRWGCIFTCIVTRAVHLEVSPTLEADDFINVLDRFTNRRGNPETMRSDCGTNFKGATNELRKEIEKMDHLKIQKSLQRKEIDWQFNPPEAPHMGGVWERLVKSVKTTLSVMISDATTMNDFTLITVLTEVEAILNSRPLTHISDDPDDLEALTPNHFLLGRPSSKQISSVEVDIRTAPRQRWKQVQSMTNQFWDRWSKEYLVTLNQRQKWLTTKALAKEGDLVMVLDKNLVRSQWTLGRIIQTIPSQDGQVRKVQVKTKDGVYIRPMTKISLLELN